MAPASRKKPAAKAKKKPAAKKTAAKKPAKKVAVKKVAKKATAKKAAPKKAKRKPSAALMRLMTPSAILAAIIGATPRPRGQIIKKLWEYIKKNGLQDKINKRLINADEKLKALFGGKSVVSMFELTKHVSKNIG